MFEVAIDAISRREGGVKDVAYFSGTIHAPDSWFMRKGITL